MESATYLWHKPSGDVYAVIIDEPSQSICAIRGPLHYSELDIDPAEYVDPYDVRDVVDVPWANDQMWEVL